DEMLHWTLTSSLQRDGSFKTVPSFFSSIGADFYFGVSFLQTIGFWDRKDRFWTERDFPEAPAICRQIKAQLKEMALKSHETEVALHSLGKTCEVSGWPLRAGGGGGIRTRDTVLAVCTLSKRVPSAARPPLRSGREAP